MLFFINVDNDTGNESFTAICRKKQKKSVTSHKKYRYHQCRIHLKKKKSFKF